jgi:transcriptional regulator with XRE-family HTH domain
VGAGLTQEELAAELAVGQAAISRIESGERAVSARMLVRLADRFGVQAGAILKSDEDALALLRAGVSEPGAVKASVEEFRSCIEDYFGVDSLVA